jgi:predicted peptidase
VIVCPQNNSGLFTPKQINDFINTSIATYSIDTTRIYLTGLIKGGYNVLNYLSDKPSYAKRIAAAVPMTSLRLDQQHVDQLHFARQTKVILFCAQQDEMFEENRMYVEKINTPEPPLQKAEFIPFDRNQTSYWKIYSPLTNWYNPNIYQRMIQYKK